MVKEQQMVYLNTKDNYYHKELGCPRIDTFLKENGGGIYAQVEERVARITYAIQCPECCKA